MVIFQTKVKRKMNRNKRSLSIRAIGLVVIAYIYFGGLYTRSRGIKHYSIFNSSNLYGRIEKLYVAYKGTALKLESDTVTYIFYPLTSPLNGNHIFDHLAARGDSVAKPAYCDTLKLFKDDEVYLYVFEQLEN